MAGLVSRFVWIWPTWDVRMLSNATPHQSTMVELGWFKTDAAGTAATAEYCACESVLVDQISGTALRRCVYNNLTTDEESTMPPDRCRAITTYTSEYVSADHVVNMMTSSPHWIAAEDVAGVIIDIDEDFFGCESPSDLLARRLQNAGGSWSQVEYTQNVFNCLEYFN